MSYYCEMCGRELDARTAKKAVVEGSLLILCLDCYSRLSKEKVVREPVVKQRTIPRQTQERLTTTKVAKTLEELEVVEDYASRIRSARESLGWTQDVLAQKVGETVSTIKRIESGKLKPSIELAKKLEKVLGIKLLEPIVRESVSSKTDENISYLTIGDIISVEDKPKKKGVQ